MDIKERLKNLQDLQKESIYHEIRKNPGSSRLKIARKLKLRANTVSDLVLELINAGLVTETQDRPSGKRGRPVRMLEISAARLVCISIYPEDLTLIASLVDMADNTLAETSVAILPETNNRAFLRILNSVLDSLISQIPAGSQLIGAGISLIGTVDGNKKVWIEATRWPRIRAISFRPIEKRIGVPVVLKRWLDTELEYQLIRNPSCNTGNSLLFHWGMGIGVAFSHKGKVIESRFGKFADIGHIFVDPDPKRVCRCGHPGCLEAVAAIWALLPVFRKEYPSMRENIHDVIKALNQTRVFEDPEFRHAFETVKKNFSNLFKLYFPDKIFFIGPFLQDPRILQGFTDEVTNIFSKNIYRNIRGRVSIEVVRNQSRFCKIANVRPFFTEKLQTMLHAADSA
jgi:transcriptional regulator of PTS gene